MSVALISHPDCLLHDMGLAHPEQPSRIRVIAKALTQAGLDAKLEHHFAPQATPEQLKRVHDANYVDQIFQLAPQQGSLALDPDTFMNPFTLDAALYAAGAVVWGVDLVMQNPRAVFCNIRPPGHHAETNQAMGFCFFNNVAVGVGHALAKYELKRIAIIDFDVHHGNGTDDIFQNDSRVQLFSSFQAPFYPFSEGYSQWNMPLPAGTTGERYREKVAKKWLPALLAFQPELIFFSAGFDAHEGDGLADLRFHVEDYEWITQEIKKIADEVCKGRIVSALEGGYSLEILAECAVAHVKALMK